MAWNLLVLVAVASLGVLLFVLVALTEKLRVSGVFDWQTISVLALLGLGIGLFAHALALRRRGLHRRAVLVLGLLAIVMLPYGLTLAGVVYVFVLSGVGF